MTLAFGARRLQSRYSVAVADRPWERRRLAGPPAAKSRPVGVRAPIVAKKGRNGLGAKAAPGGGYMTDRPEEVKPEPVPETAKPTGEVGARWAWTDPAVWTERICPANQKARPT